MLQKKKAEGPTDPQQPAKKQKIPPAEPIAAMTTPTGTPATHTNGPDVLKAEIEAQGSRVRELKSAGADKVGGVVRSWPHPHVM